MIKLNGSLIDEIKFYLIPLLLLFSFVTGWIVFYVIPQDHARAEIMECMGDRLWTEAVYDQCADMIQRTRASP